MNALKTICVLLVGLAMPGFNANATTTTDTYSFAKSIKKGLYYLNSVQFEYGEFPTLFYPNFPEKQMQKYASYDSNLFTTVMIADALHEINYPLVERIKRKVVTYVKEQLNNEYGLWSYFTTHNPHPLYPSSVYDLDDTAFASMVLQQNHESYPDNLKPINDNKDEQGVYLTFIQPPFNNDVDCGVNANVLSYLQSNDEKVCHYLNQQVLQNKSCAQYYSQNDAYYLIARAYHSGVSCLAPAVEPIISKVRQQVEEAKKSPIKAAIALNTLLDLGYQGPETKKLVMSLFLSQSRFNGSWPAAPFWLWAGSDAQGNPKLLGRSGSSALTTALVLRAFNRLA